jgi:aryl-alcohol dehydrogenase-like predicted oxidoreductase
MNAIGLLPSPIHSAARPGMSRLSNISRLTLGTAQLGMRYGAVNTQGDPGLDGAFAVLDAAAGAQIDCIDTARLYGKAETRIGAWRKHRNANPVLISKLPKLHAPHSADAITAMFEQSTAALGVPYIDGYLCHSAINVNDRTVLAVFERLMSEDRISGFGTTLYSPAELETALSVAGLGMVQLPLSIAHSRFAHNGLIARAAERGVLVFARSVYLQGVLLVPPERLPPWLSPLTEPLRKLRALAADNRTDIPHLALAAVNAVPGVHSIVIGAETPDQLQQSVAALQKPAPEPELIAQAWSLFKDIPDELTDPSRWPNR